MTNIIAFPTEFPGVQTPDHNTDNSLIEEISRMLEDNDAREIFQLQVEAIKYGFKMDGGLSVATAPAGLNTEIDDPEFEDYVKDMIENPAYRRERVKQHQAIIRSLKVKEA